MQDFLLTADELRARGGYKWRKHPPDVLPADVVQGVAATLLAYSKPGDGVIVQTPSYPPFLRVVAGTTRRLVENPLILSDRFTLDLDGLRVAASHARVLLLCNPHNPTGRVF